MTLPPARAAAPGAGQTAGPDTGPLSDLVTDYAQPLPSTAWVKHLKLESPRVNLRCLPLSVRILKRAVDLTGAVLLLIVCSPLMLAAAVLVALTSPGPVIFRQVRVGVNLRSPRPRDRRRMHRLPAGQSDRRRPDRDRREVENYGRPFVLYKFRTMRMDAERHGARFAEAGDPRVTPIGWFLRRTRIDELPQLWNVIRGDMSLVGPRPERPEFMQQLTSRIPGYVDRLGLKPGLTGIAQVVNGYDNEWEGFRRKVGYDLLYLQNCCLINDLRILLRTIRVVITGQGAL